MWLGCASVSTILKSLCDVLGLTNVEECFLNLHITDSTIKIPLGRINDVLILVNRNYVPTDFYCSSPIFLGRPFLRTISAVIDMKEGNIKFQFPLRKGMEHFPRKKNQATLWINHEDIWWVSNQRWQNLDPCFMPS